MKNNIEKNTNTQNTSFAKGLNFYKLFWIFYIGCFAGVVVECVWCIFKNGFFEYRTALILEPLNPVYGVGAVLISLCFVRMTGWKNIYIYIGSFIVGGLFEWLCSVFQELVFGTISWNYTPSTLGILGNRTSLIYCFFWGFLGVIWVRLIYPFLSRTIESIPKKTGKILTWVFVFIVSFDILFSAGASLRQKDRRNNIPPKNSIDVFYDTYFNDEVLKHFYHNITVKD